MKEIRLKSQKLISQFGKEIITRRDFWEIEIDEKTKPEEIQEYIQILTQLKIEKLGISSKGQNDKMAELLKMLPETIKGLELRIEDGENAPKVDLDFAQLGATKLKELSIEGSSIQSIKNIPESVKTLEASDCNQMDWSAVDFEKFWNMSFWDINFKSEDLERICMSRQKYNFTNCDCENATELEKGFLMDYKIVSTYPKLVEDLENLSQREILLLERSQRKVIVSVKDLEKLKGRKEFKGINLVVRIDSIAELSCEQLETLEKEFSIQQIQVYNPEVSNKTTNSPYDIETYKAIVSKANELVEGIPDNWKEQEKFREIYKRICQHIVYDYIAAYPDEEKVEEQEYAYRVKKECRNLENGLVRRKVRMQRLCGYFKKCVCLKRNRS